MHQLPSNWHISKYMISIFPLAISLGLCYKCHYWLEVEFFSCINQTFWPQRHDYIKLWNPSTGLGATCCSGYSVTCKQWMPINSEYEHHLRLSLFPWARNFTHIAQYWLKLYPHCLVLVETLPTLLSTGCFQERTQACIKQAILLYN